MERFVNLTIVSVGMTIGSWVPTLFGAGLFDAWSILGTAIGGGVGIYFILKLNS